MCIGDYRIDRFVRTAVTTVTIANATNHRIAANRQRVGLAIGTGPSESISIRLRLADNTTHIFGSCGGGIYGPLLITMRDYGDLVTKDLFLGHNSGVSQVCNYVEMFLPESVLREFLETLEGRK